MTTKQNALERIRVNALLLQQCQLALKQEQERFAELCRETYDDFGCNDREIAEATVTDLDAKGYSRARIQQFRKGDSRKKVAA